MLKVNIFKMEILSSRAGMNFSQLAEKACVSRQTISTINGRKTCRPDTVLKIAAALGVDVTEIVEQEGA